MPGAHSASRNPVLVALAWLLVVAPTLWGLSYTVKNAAKLFASHTAPAAAPAASGPAMPAR